MALGNCWNQYLEETQGLRNMHGCIIPLQSQYQGIGEYTSLKPVQSDNYIGTLHSLFIEALHNTNLKKVHVRVSYVDMFNSRGKAF